MSVTTTHEQPNTISTTSYLDSISRDFFLNLSEPELKRYENELKLEYNLNSIKFSLKETSKIEEPKTMVEHLKQ